ncbi:hypothetical protein [Nocardioides luteus]|uniref:Uncharacterized protein n=1 Tax=Nocardioides luteus TaxID=1844 RepID=A0A1J4N4Y0_9ACTN|nr:hypothetical protein [Nocardioides luteus]OIJ26023.1 hypothetical protein UG56_014590 [Nocardioides luteus]
MQVSITTAEVMARLPSPTDWRREPLVQYLSCTSGDLPPLGFLVNEASSSAKASCRAAALQTLRIRYAADGMTTYVAALRDRSGEASLLAATAISELGDGNEQKEFFDWARRRISRKSRLNNWDMHELVALIQYSHRTDNLDQLARLLRRFHRNLAPDEHAALNRHASTLLDPDVDPGSISGKDVDVDAILDWAHSATGTMFGDHDLEPGEIELVEKDIRDLLRLS